MLYRIDAQRVARLNAPEPETQSSDWLSVTSNNHGFFSPHDYPYRAENENEFLPGIFGGSVAQWFCLQQGKSLARDMTAIFSGTRAVEIEFRVRRLQTTAEHVRPSAFSNARAGVRRRASSGWI